MIGAQLCHRTVSGFWTATDQANVGRSISNSLVYSSNRLSFQLGFKRRHFRKSKSILVYCRSSRGSFDGKFSNNNEERDHEYLEAFVLLPETIRHYRMRMQGFQEDMEWQSSSQSLRFSVQAKDPRAQVSSIGLAFLRRFQNPTIFLKISCEGDFLLPIIVGEFAVERLIDSSTEDGSGDSPNQFQLVRNLVGKLGYEVKMVKITERVVNTYFARIFFCKPGESDILSVDARPSDAINVAKICKAPIYVNKQIVLSDAIRIAYGMGRARDAKCIYDVILDSAADGPDLLLEELNLVRNLNLAVKEERYSDAAMMREKLTRLRESGHEL